MPTNANMLVLDAIILQKRCKFEEQFMRQVLTAACAIVANPTKPQGPRLRIHPARFQSCRLVFRYQ